MEEREVRRLFGKQNSRKAAGPDAVSSSTVKHCADQFFAPAQSGTQQVRKIVTLNNYRPGALTSGVIKVSERLVLK